MCRNELVTPGIDAADRFYPPYSTGRATSSVPGGGRQERPAARGNRPAPRV
jgi:hypothetical protein